jgi:TATA-binding protein-associated factor Taf7
VHHEEGEGEEDDVSVLLADSFASSSDVGSGEVEAELRKRFRVARDGTVRSWEEVREEAATVLQRQVRRNLEGSREGGGGAEGEEGAEEETEGVSVVCVVDAAVAGPSCVGPCAWTAGHGDTATRHTETAAAAAAAAS